MVDGFRRPGARGISEGVKGTGGAGGEDKERSGTGAALTPKRRALDGKRPSTQEGHMDQGDENRRSPRLPWGYELSNDLPTLRQ